MTPVAIPTVESMSLEDAAPAKKVVEVEDEGDEDDVDDAEEGGEVGDAKKKKKKKKCMYPPITLARLHVQVSRS
jgi:hypothetical protein